MNTTGVYDKIDSLILQYQAGINPQEAALGLISLFNPLFHKYIKLIKTSSIDFFDFDSRDFVSLFIKDQATRDELRSHGISLATKEAVSKALHRIKTALYQFSEEDLTNEFIVIFLKIAARYEAQKGFCAYLKGSFRYEVAKFVAKVMNDPLSTAVVGSNEPTDLGFCRMEELFEIPAPAEELDSHWIYGACSDIFKGLTPLERLIIKLFYIDHQTDIEIAKITGYHRNWVGIRRRAAIEQIKQKLKELKLFAEEKET